MKASTKRFLALYFGAYALIAIAVNAWLGPPGLSKDYLAAHKHDHDRYLTITKDDAYRRWQERPELNPPDQSLAQDIEFVETYESTPEFHAEKQRRHRYSLFFDFFRAGMVALLALRFGRIPARRFIEGRINEVRHRIERVELAREAAKESRLIAEKKLEVLPDERASILSEAETRIEAERARVREATAIAVAMSDQETRDRTQFESMRAHKDLRESVIDEAIAVVVDRYAAQPLEHEDDALVDRFLRELESTR